MFYLLAKVTTVIIIQLVNLVELLGTLGHKGSFLEQCLMLAQAGSARKIFNVLKQFVRRYAYKGIADSG